MTDDGVETTPTKRPSITDVAALAGVSEGAVSKVIRNAYGVSPAMRERVQSAIERLDYRPSVAARAMRGQSFTIGIELPQMGNEFFTQVIHGAGRRLAGTGFQLIVAPAFGELKGAPILNSLLDRQVDGIIAVSPEVTPEWLERLTRHVPVVLLGRHDLSRGYDTVTNDDAVGVNLVMDHLFALGHSRIAHVTVHPPVDTDQARANHAIRREVFEDRMHAAGFDPVVVFVEPLEAEAYRAAINLLSGGTPPTAIFAGHDTLAVGVLRAVADLGLEASDVSVVGYDDIELAKHPLVSLTTVDQFGAESGEAAIDFLMERIRGEREAPRHHNITPQLRIRNSSARAAQADRPAEKPTKSGGEAV